MTASYQANLEHAMATRGRDHPVWRHNGKLKGRAFAQSLGVRVPDLLAGPCSVEAFDPPNRPATLKPVQGCSSLGVFLLVPDGDRYRELLSGHDMTWRQVKAAAYKAKQPRPALDGHADAVRHPWILEELVGDGTAPPQDFKAFCFGGRVELIRQFRRTRRGFTVKAWSRDWEPLGVVDTTARYDHDMTQPEHPTELVEVFELVARNVESPFIRVDLYDDHHGPVFGEITPHPAGGTLRFTPQWDRRLGEAWDTAVK